LPDERPLHSAEWFGDERDFWWNRDYLELVARRFSLAEARTVLDVGSGIGHWGRTLAAVLRADARIVGVDPEPEWVEEARRRAAAYGLGERFEYVQGAVERLPFEDGRFDLVTCQTVLIHVADVRAALREMLRVTRPGGRLLLAEPNNRASVLVDSSVTAGASVEERLDLLRFVLTCERGKEALGEVGDLVPGMLVDEGAIDVDVFVSDKASATVPPYAGAEQQALAGAVLERAGTSGFGWSHSEARRLFLAGGGDEGDFDQLYERRVADSERAAAAVRDGWFHSAGGVLMYVIGARRAG
jgi:SAM-dependent methyltransferase